MLKLFKRPKSTVRTPAPKARTEVLMFEPPPLPEVTEGDTDADWALWEAATEQIQAESRPQR